MKNKKITTIIAVLLAAVLGFGAVAFATDGLLRKANIPTVTVNADKLQPKADDDNEWEGYTEDAITIVEGAEGVKKFTHTDGSGVTHDYLDLFPDLKNLMPGDTSAEQTIRVKVDNLSSIAPDTVEVFLRAENDRVYEKNHSITGDGDYDVTDTLPDSDPNSVVASSYNDAYSKISEWVTVKVDGKIADIPEVTYNSDPAVSGTQGDSSATPDEGNGENTAGENGGNSIAEPANFGKSLGVFKTGENAKDSAIITVQVNVPLDAGNEFQDLVAEIGWTFTAIRRDVETPAPPTPPVIPDPPVPTVPELDTENHFAYIIGYPDGNVKPENNISREEVATIFFRLLTDESRMEYWKQTNDFSDVKTSRWSNNAISTMSNAAIVNGYPNGTFGPGKPITRAEFAAIAARFDSQPYEGGTDKFSDISGHWAADYINRAAERGWINGYEDGTFKPDQYITRAEAMTLVNRVLNRRTHAEDMLDDMVKWPDNATWAWYYEAVQEATNGHDYAERKNPATDYEKWTKMQEPRDWAALEKEWTQAADNIAKEKAAAAAQ